MTHYKCTCRRCGQIRYNTGRKLCHECRRITTEDGTLYDYPIAFRRIDDFLEDFVELTSQGYNHRQISERLRYPLNSMRRQITRARKRGLLPAWAGA